VVRVVGSDIPSVHHPCSLALTIVSCAALIVSSCFTIAHDNRVGWQCFHNADSYNAKPRHLHGMSRKSRQREMGKWSRKFEGPYGRMVCLYQCCMLRSAQSSCRLHSCSCSTSFYHSLTIKFEKGPTPFRRCAVKESKKTFLCAFTALIPSAARRSQPTIFFRPSVDWSA